MIKTINNDSKRVRGKTFKMFTPEMASSFKMKIKLWKRSRSLCDFSNRDSRTVC